MLFDKLTVDQLKKELNKRELPTTGLKSELQQRLREACEKEGLNLGSHDFSKEPEEHSMMDMLQGMIQNMNSNFEKMMDGKFEKMDGKFENMDGKSEKMDEKFQSINGELESQKTETSKNFQSMYGGVKESISTEINKNISKAIYALKIEQQKDLKNLEENIDSKFEYLENRLRKLEIREDKATVGIMKDYHGPKMDLPTFDGSRNFSSFRLQFETMADRCKWSMGERCTALIGALKGDAVDVVYDAIICALERNFDNHGRKELYRFELMNCHQKSNETLEEFSRRIERLANLAYPESSPDYVDKEKKLVFKNGLYDSELKFAALTSNLPTFAETFAHVAILESVRAESKPGTRLRQVTFEDQATLDSLVKKVKVLEDATKKEVVCYRCGKRGHIARNCRERSHSPSLPSKNN